MLKLRLIWIEVHTYTIQMQSGLCFHLDSYYRASHIEMWKVISVRQIEIRDYVRGGAEGALAPPEFEGSERRTEGETDNPLLIAPSESKS